MPTPRDRGPRINQAIRKSPVRLIGSDGSQLGIVPVEDAQRRAEEENLDLVEVGPTADPPVVRILDWGKVKYEKEKQAREARKKAHVIEVKEIKYRPAIDTHDFDIKTNRAKRFLKEGKKVKITVFFRYKELRRPELGSDILERIVAETKDLAEVESRTRMESRRMIMILAPIGHEGV
jgi:translation initiation factor IF-3